MRLMDPRVGCACMGCVAVVCPSSLTVEEYIAAGRRPMLARPPCPNCLAPMSFDGCYPRLVRHGGTIQQLWVRRGVCSRCAASHALLPEFLLARRLDTLDTISHALAGRPEPQLARSTLAGWRRRLGTNRPAIVAGTGS